MRDKLLKRDLYARLGVAHYWIVDLDDPSVTVLELSGGIYREHLVARTGNTSSRAAQTRSTSSNRFRSLSRQQT